MSFSPTNALVFSESADAKNTNLPAPNTNIETVAFPVDDANESGSETDEVPMVPRAKPSNFVIDLVSDEVPMATKPSNFVINLVSDEDEDSSEDACSKKRKNMSSPPLNEIEIERLMEELVQAMKKRQKKSSKLQTTTATTVTTTTTIATSALCPPCATTITSASNSADVTKKDKKKDKKKDRDKNKKMRKKKRRQEKSRIKQTDRTNNTAITAVAVAAAETCVAEQEKPLTNQPAVVELHTQADIQHTSQLNGKVHELQPQGYARAQRQPDGLSCSLNLAVHDPEPSASSASSSTSAPQSSPDTAQRFSADEDKEAEKEEEKEEEADDWKISESFAPGFPPELTSIVEKFLHALDFCSVSRTCKAWNKAFAAPKYYRRFLVPVNSLVVSMHTAKSTGRTRHPSVHRKCAAQLSCIRSNYFNRFQQSAGFILEGVNLDFDSITALASQNPKISHLDLRHAKAKESFLSGPVPFLSSNLSREFPSVADMWIDCFFPGRKLPQFTALRSLGISTFFVPETSFFKELSHPSVSFVVVKPAGEENERCVDRILLNFPGLTHLKLTNLCVRNKPVLVHPRQDQIVARAKEFGFRFKAEDNTLLLYRASKTTEKLCPKDNQPLALFSVPTSDSESSFTCDVCEVTQPRNAPMYGCREHDYDVCLRCTVQVNKDPTLPPQGTGIEPTLLSLSSSSSSSGS